MITEQGRKNIEANVRAYQEDVYRTMHPETITTSGVVHVPPRKTKYNCSYCHAYSLDDAHGNCSCCGAPRDHQIFGFPVVYDEEFRPLSCST
jgi:hypothetical protein